MSEPVGKAQTNPSSHQQGARAREQGDSSTHPQRAQALALTGGSVAGEAMKAGAEAKKGAVWG